MKRILGIDPGSRITGYGIIEVDGRKMRHVASGCVRTGNGALGDRLKIIFDGVREVVAAHQPSELAIEKVFVQRNVDSALKLGQARGAAICAAVDFALQVFEYAPNQIKQAVVGQGHADKGQVQHMVRVILSLADAPASDAADALAVAICHSHIHATVTRYQRAVAGGKP